MLNKPNQKYRAFLGLDCIRNESFELVMKTVDQWKVYAKRLAKQKTKLEKFDWEASVFFANDSEIHGKSFDYVRISFYHKY